MAITFDGRGNFPYSGKILDRLFFVEDFSCMGQFSSRAFLCFEEISSMRQISSIMHPRHDDYFEDISHIAEKSSNSGSPCRAPKNAIEENCLWQDISSTKNSRKVKNSRKTARNRKYPRKRGKHKKKSIN